jgi:predicted aspartyl protease
MANAIYPKWKEAIMQASANSSLGGTVKAALVDTGTYTYSATHEFLTSLTGRVGTDQTLGSKTFTDGTFDAANSVFPAVTGATVEALVIYIDTGTAGTSRLVAYIDTGVTGLPVTPNGGDINVNWNASGIFRLGA